MKFDTWTESEFRQHLQALGITTRKEWETTCNDSFKEAARRKRSAYRAITEGIIRDPYHRRRVPKQPKSKHTIDFCVENRILTSSDLLAVNRKRWLELGGQDCPEFWLAVRIILGLDKLPADFDPKDSPLPLSVERLLALGYEPPPVT